MVTVSRHFVASDPEYLVQLEHILKCLHILESALRKCNSQVECHIKREVEEAVVSSVQDW